MRRRDSALRRFGCARRTLSRAWPKLEILEDRTLPALLDFSSLAVDPQRYDASQLLIRFQSDAARTQFHMTGVTLGEALPLVSNLYIANLSGGVSVVQALEALEGNPLVLYAQPDYALHLELTPNDPSYATQQWDLNNTGQSGGTVDADIDAPEAWDTTTGNRRIIVAVIDTGVDYNHPDLAANIWTNTAELNGLVGVDDDGNGFVDDVHGYDFVNGDGDPMDDNSHGTHCAGTIGAVGNNSTGIAGIIWNVQIMAVKFLNASGSGSTSDAIKSLNYAVQMGAKLSNNSWGGGGYDPAMYSAISNARAAGHIFVAAAGNASSNNDITPFYPASYNLDNVVAVAATDRYDNLASYSNYGAVSVDLGAPGSSIYSTTPGNTYGLKSGTSMATPHVTGALALVWDLHPAWTYSQVISQILSNVDPLPALAGKTVTGGRLNLAKAVGSPMQPALSINDASVIEGNSGSVNVTFTVSLSAASTGTVTVDYATADGTATAGSDYTGASGMLTFGPGDTSMTIIIAVLGDTTIEGDESFYVNLTNASGATISDSQGLGTLRNDDTAISISDVSLSEGNSGPKNAVFTVTLAAASALPVSVDFATADGTAAAGSDYTAVSGTVSFAAGETSKTITVAVLGDTAVESNETFFVNLTNPVNATISDDQGLGTIVDDDTGLTLSINDVSALEGNKGLTNFVFTVTLSAASSASVTVDYATADSTASSASDYQSRTGTLTFNPGQTSKTITIKVRGDKIAEADETFFVNLANASNATLADAQGLDTIRNDDGTAGAADSSDGSGAVGRNTPDLQAWSAFDDASSSRLFSSISDPLAQSGSVAPQPSAADAVPLPWSNAAQAVIVKSGETLFQPKVGGSDSANLLVADLFAPSTETR